MASARSTVAAGAALALVALLVAQAPSAVATPLPPRDLTFFLHYVNATETARALPGSGATWTYFDTTTDWNDVNVTLIANGSLQTYDWYLSTPLAAPVTVTAGSLAVWTEFISGVPNAQTTIDVQERTASGSEALVATSNLGSQTFTSTPSLKVLDLGLPGSHTFAAGSSIHVSLKVNPGGGVLHVIFDTARADSRVTFTSTSALQIAAPALLDSGGNATGALDPAAANTTARLRVIASDPLGGYDIAWARATLLAPGGTPVFDNLSLARTAGTPVSENATFELAWNYSGLAPGRYLALVFLMDNNGETWYAHFAHFAYGPYGAAAAVDVFVGLEPLFGWFEVTDDEGLPLEGARLSLAGAVGPGSTATTGADGRANLSASPGNYTLSVVWADTQVAQVPAPFVANVTAADPVDVHAAVYYPRLVLVDSRGSPLGGASVTYTPPNGTALLVPLLTAANGSIGLGRAPGGDYRVVAQWETLVVLDRGVTVNASGTTTLGARVYYLDLRVLDSRGTGVAFAALVARDNATGLVLAYALTDLGGAAQARLPGSTLDIAASTRDVQVVDQRGVAVTADMQLNLSAAVFYLAVSIAEEGGAPVSGARLTVRSAGGTVTETAVTDGAGAAAVRLPGATYSLSVEWFGQTLASNATLQVAADLNLSYTATVHALRLLISDSQSLPVEGATVELRSGDGTDGTVAAGLTGPDGGVLFAAPAGSWRVIASWRGVEVVNATVAVAGDEAVPLRAAVGVLSAVAEDREGRPLNRAVISVSNASTGAGLLVAYTGTDGRASFRLPQGEYNVTCNLVATYLLSPIDETETRVVLLNGTDSQVEITLAKFPPSLLTTNAFALALLFFLAMVGVAAFVYIRYQRPGRAEGDDEDDESPAPEPRPPA